MVNPNGPETNTSIHYPAGGAMRVDGTLYFVLKDHLGSSLEITDGEDGTLISEQRYMPFGQERADIGPITQTDLGYTGQRDVGMGLMDYKARFYDPYLGRFIQPDSLVASPRDTQSFNRYSYVLNNPIIYNDPTGQKECVDNDEHGNCLSSTQVLIRDIESDYKIKITGGWDEKELILYSDALDKAVKWAGGIDNLNDIFLDAITKNGSSASVLTVYNRSGFERPIECNGGWACWDNKDTIIFSDFIFTKPYQEQHSSGFLSGPYHSLDLEIEFTMIHEIAHVFADARPLSVGAYVWSVKNNPLAFYRRSCGGAHSCFEENMASAIALYAVTEGASNSRFQSQINFVTRVQYYWHYWQAAP